MGRTTSDTGALAYTQAAARAAKISRRPDAMPMAPGNTEELDAVRHSRKTGSRVADGSAAMAEWIYQMAVSGD